MVRLAGYPTHSTPAGVRDPMAMLDSMEAGDFHVNPSTVTSTFAASVLPRLLMLTRQK